MSRPCGVPRAVAFALSISKPPAAATGKTGAEGRVGGAAAEPVTFEAVVSGVAVPLSLIAEDPLFASAVEKPGHSAGAGPWDLSGLPKPLPPAMGAQAGSWPDTKPVIGTIALMLFYVGIHAPSGCISHSLSGYETWLYCICAFVPSTSSGSCWATVAVGTTSLDKQAGTSRWSSTWRCARTRLWGTDRL